jgi:ferredoxin
VELSRKIYAGDTSLIPEEPAPQVFNPTRVSDAVAAGDPKAELFAADEMENLEDYQKAIHFRLIYDQTKCLYPSCQRCMDFCPVNGIDMTMEPRVIGKPCMNCMMCDQICPTGAISVDEDQMQWQARIEDYPGKAKDVRAMVEQIKKQKKERPDYPGFKYYVSEEQTAEGYGHQVYQVFNKRPRFIVGYGRPYGIDPATQEDRGPAKGM